MSLSEFNIISGYFKDFPPLSGLKVGIGDDAAVLTHSQEDLLISIDTLIAGVHFPTQTCAFDVAYKALAVNLSDLAAMGASPLWMTLALTLPEADSIWLEDFSAGLKSLAYQFNVALIGGDTTRGHLSITIQVAGVSACNQAILRSGAMVGDAIFVTANIGDAGLALAILKGTVQTHFAEMPLLLAKLNRPFPRIKQGLALTSIASAMIDISDGLLADLGHIVEQSQVGATINLEDIPISTAMTQHVAKHGWQLPLTAGDDFELCFTVPKKNLGVLQNLPFDFYCIGEIISGSDISCCLEGQVVRFEPTCYRHF